MAQNSRDETQVVVYFSIYQVNPFWDIPFGDVIVRVLLQKGFGFPLISLENHQKRQGFQTKTKRRATHNPNVVSPVSVLLCLFIFVSLLCSIKKTQHVTPETDAGRKGRFIALLIKGGRLCQYGSRHVAALFPTPGPRGSLLAHELGRLPVGLRGLLPAEVPGAESSTRPHFLIDPTPG